MPVRKPSAVAVTKLRSASSSTGRNGRGKLIVWTTKRTKATAQTEASITISLEPNQPLFWPRSRNNCSAASAMLSRAKPITSNGTFWSAFCSCRKVITPTRQSTPIGRLMKKTQRQEKSSVSQPPSTGPRMGATITPMPQMPMIGARSSGV